MRKKMVGRVFFLAIFAMKTHAWITQESPLISATKKGDFQTMRLLIHEGADVNSREGTSWPHAGQSALSCSIDAKNYEAVQLLLESGARCEILVEVPCEHNFLKPRTRNLDHLSYAIMVNAPLSILNLLIAYSVDINAADPIGGWTPYTIAYFYKNELAMHALVEAGAHQKPIPQAQ